MFGSLFDERFAGAAAGIYAYAPVRLVLCVAVTIFVGMGVGWAAALPWCAAALLAEAALLIATRQTARAPQGRAISGRACALVYMLAVLTWSMAGVLLWSADSVACQVAAAAFFASHLMYIQALHAHSPGAAIPTLPAVLLPAGVPLALPHFQGSDQALVCLSMLVVSLHTLVSMWVSLRKSRALQEAQTAIEAASDAKSAFLARMSHEIRTPLNGVLGMAQALAAETDLKPEHRRRLSVIQESGESLLVILNDILDLSKVEAGRLELEKIPFDLGEVVRAAQEAFGPQAATKGVSFRVDLDPRAAGVYLGDPTRFRQILYNLLSNAVKFTDRGEVALAVSWRNEVLEVEVSDSGVGIAPEDLARLFSRFQQVDTSTTRRYGGTGLGLSICRELAELMGGAIEAHSAPGTGARFTLLLPLRRVGDAETQLREVETPAERSAAALAEGGPPLRVLAAEDNAVNQLVLRTLLEQIGIDPVIVGDGAAAVEAWRATPCDLILMDVEMPVLDGVAAARAIRDAEAAEGRPRTPILALTANAMQHQVTAYLAAGLDGHVAKPIDAAQLYEAIASAAQSSRGDAAAVA
ncbi:ATP-binding protein [Phenylobacterium kunshanense]|uniref:Sensory/regulatory protein RpfC n=1 Tax=Phenylobacterium kunshanense TaxID=1445034 RepID=A0A328BJW9_9CAUL|nr:ATP-binding protein [Phenylobacterium kunshanense]RAK67277.1 hybrid sensor histidine kinase/response regulator [Phenylobacterium kunshanense]